ncbi:Fic family protein [Xenorhabdus lircayensis]|uniref:Fic family protein n=1 Tax=Xenorhabdus lircayensis TaxID=2763499 RepID=A0ABS0U683_9GAMM|nr:Fic family protein [Xenorhabdus lircayensis]MBI6549391.1 Fic family protein [Xenorhabdus lircayensis]
MKIKRPPTLINIAEMAPSTFFANISITKAIDDEGRYLPWDKLRHRLPAGTEPIAYWSIVRFLRNKNIQQLSLTGDNTDQPAKLFTTSIIKQTCSTIDRLTSSAGQAELLEPLNASQYLFDELIAEESISSSQLEGAATTSQVALEMLKIQRPPRDESERMIMGNHRMMAYVTEHCNNELTPAFIKELHAVAVEGINDDKYKPAQFRTSNDVVVSGVDGEIIHTPPSYKEIEQRIDELCLWANTLHERQSGVDYLHPLIKAIVLHFMMGFIHPFNDGNGRTARALFYWYMLRCGYTAFKYISISKLLKNSSTAYAKAYCYTETDQFDLTYFVDYQCQIVGRAVEEYLSYIKIIIKTQAEMESFLYESNIISELNARQRALLNIAFARPGNIFTVAEIRSRMGVSDNTARNDLKRLEKLGLLQTHKDGKEIVYVAPKSLSQISKWKEKIYVKSSGW